MTLFPFIDLPPISSSDAVTSDLLARIREASALQKTSGDFVAALGKTLLTMGFSNEAARFGEWGEVQKEVRADKAVSIYVPCYNGGAFLQETLQAIFNQSFRPCEVIVVDDGSTDNSVDIAKQFPVRLIQHDKNRGLAASRNTALKAVGGEFIAGIDADTTIDRFWLERVMKLFTDDSIVGAAGRLVERHGTTSADAWRRTMMAQHHGDVPQKGIHLFGCNSVIRTKALRNLGGFNEACKTSFDDIDLSERILKSGATTAYTPIAVCYHGRSDTSRSIIESAYRWRVPPFEMQGAFKEVSLLSAKWLTEVREGLKDVQNVASEGKRELLFISYAGIFISIVIDLEMFFNERPGEQRTNFAYVGLALLLRSVSELKNIGPQTKQECAARIIERFSRSFSNQQKIAAIRSGVLEGLKPDALLQKLGIAIDEDLKRLIVALGELGSVLSLPPNIGAEIESNVRDIVYEDAHSFGSGKNRHAIVTTREIAGTTWGKTVIEALKSKHEGAWHIFTADTSRWRVFELSEELRSAKPTHISILMHEGDVLQRALLVPIIARNPAAHISFVSQTPLPDAPIPVEVM